MAERTKELNGPLFSVARLRQNMLRKQQTEGALLSAPLSANASKTSRFKLLQSSPKRNLVEPTADLALEVGHGANCHVD